MDINNLWKNYWKEFKKKTQYLFDFAELGNFDEIKKIIQDEPSIINNKLNHDLSALHLASKEGHYKICELLIEKGATIDI